ncbi:ExeA family protein [Variovorax terrae]|uniref:AAA family ATPase n=1 Tax=Variovorax terrae TaxID=2923278 RepID=A0A9X1VUI2_9BURK|nr:AAA family ATPase [Variovorax terrae]MCJ0763495.1 AAA family ATPase [Variovorax terrae]
MYAQFFGLKQDPFSIAPDPHYLFMSERHREALAHLLYGLGGGGGFVLLSGEIGTGKTTVCRCFLEQIPANCNVAYIFNPKLTAGELLQSVCDEFRIPVQHAGPGAPTAKDFTDPLNAFLLRTHAAGQNNVLIIDEAQNLSADVLEQLRLLTNLETNERKLLQIILIGQPELRKMLARPELEQLAQRVIARFHLDALTEAETAQYIRHRLAVAGLSGALPFDRKALQRIHQLSRGVPRRINLLCGRALLGAYANGQATVDRRVVDKAAAEVFDPAETAAPARGRAAAWGLGLISGAALFGAGLLAFNSSLFQPATAVATASPARAAAPAAKASAAATPASSPAAAAATPAASAAAGPAFLVRDESEAWRALAASWPLALGEGDPCQAAQRQQVQCFRSSRTSLALIRQLGRPGLLTVYDESRQPGYALLTGLTEQDATLVLGGAAQTVPLTALAEIWRGDYATFWRSPPGYSGKTADSPSGPVAQWLAAQLAAQQPARTPAARETPLRARVYAFQLAQGLVPDGRAGPITFMQLNRAAGVEEPRLQTGNPSTNRP